MKFLQYFLIGIGVLAVVCIGIVIGVSVWGPQTKAQPTAQIEEPQDDIPADDLRAKARALERERLGY